MHVHNIRRIPLASAHGALAVARLDEVINTLLREHMIATLACNDTILPLRRLNRALQTRLERPKFLLQQLISCTVYPSTRRVTTSVTVTRHGQSWEAWTATR